MPIALKEHVLSTKIVQEVKISLNIKIYVITTSTGFKTDQPTPVFKWLPFLVKQELKLLFYFV